MRFCYYPNKKLYQEKIYYFILGIIIYLLFLIYALLYFLLISNAKINIFSWNFNLADLPFKVSINKKKITIQYIFCT